MDNDEATKHEETLKAAPPESARNSTNPSGDDLKEVTEENKVVDNADHKDIVNNTQGDDDQVPLEPADIPQDPNPTLEKLAEEIERCISSLPRPSESINQGSINQIQQEEEKDDGAKQEAAEDTKENDKKEEEEKDAHNEKDENDVMIKGESTEVDKDEKEAKNNAETEEKDVQVEDVKEDEKVDDNRGGGGGDVTVREEMDLVPDELLRLVTMFLSWVDNICSEGGGRWGTQPDEDALFLEAVDRMAKTMELLLSICSMGLKFEERHGGLINHLSNIQHRALSYLEEEFRYIVEECKPELEGNVCNINKDSHKGKNVNDHESESSSSMPEPEEDQQAHFEFPGYSEEAVTNMSKIATQMISGGYEFECCEIYLITRRHAFDNMLHKHGLEKHSIDDIQKMQHDNLEREIVCWVKAFKLCSSFYFLGERALAESVFTTKHAAISSILYSNLARGAMTQLLNFAEAIAMSKRAAEKLFKTLDMYEALKEGIPKMDELFPAECLNELKTEATTVRCRLGEAAISIFCDLENSIKSDTGRSPVPGGAVHPLTRYTLNYLRYACENKDTLEFVFREHSKIERADSTSRPNDRDNYDPNDASLVLSDDESPFSMQLLRVMDLLDSNLETKSKLYRDVALSSIFMMNNGRYILQKIKGAPEINVCMGDTWCRRRSSELRQYHKNYQRETWGRLLSFLTHEGLSHNGKVMKPVLKERFKSFNAMFDEIHKTQTTWVVSDEQLQSELRVSISAVVIPAYRSFLGRFSQVLDPGRQTEKYIKLQPEDIETYIDELFDGNPNPSIFRRRP